MKEEGNRVMTESKLTRQMKIKSNTVIRITKWNTTSLNNKVQEIIAELIDKTWTTTQTKKKGKCYRNHNQYILTYICVNKKRTHEQK